jgi:hypothetical protein
MPRSRHTGGTASDGVDLILTGSRLMLVELTVRGPVFGKPPSDPVVGGPHIRPINDRSCYGFPALLMMRQFRPGPCRATWSPRAGGGAEAAGNDLAASVNDLAVDLAEAGRRTDGLTAAQETVDLYEELASTEPELYKPRLDQATRLGADLGSETPAAPRSDRAGAFTRWLSRNRNRYE